MKTLKQRMETELDTSLYLCNDFDEIESEFLRLVKEWLTQKQKTQKIFSNHHKYLIDLIYNELLGELE